MKIIDPQEALNNAKLFTAENLHSFTKEALEQIEAQSKRGKTECSFYAIGKEYNLLWRESMYHASYQLTCLGYKVKIDAKTPTVIPFQLIISWI